MAASESEVTESLQNLQLTKEKLLGVCHGTITLESVPIITNEVVLDLSQFMNLNPECTYHTLSQWLSNLLGERCPKEEFPTVKAIRQSILRLHARLSKIKKGLNSQSREKKIADFFNEEYHLPVIFVDRRGNVHKSNRVASTTGDEVLKSVNVDLCTELKKLELENLSLRTTEEQLTDTRQKMYSVQRNATKKLRRREETIDVQAKAIVEKSKELDQLHRKVVQLEPQVEKLRQERDRIHHRAAYWKQRCNDLKCSHEEQELLELGEQQRKIEKLTVEVDQLEQDNVDLHETVEEIMTASNNEIVTFHNGKYTDDVQACCYELLSLNVGVQKVVPVIKAVLGTLTDKIFDRMPSKTLMCRMMIECLTLAHAQLGEELSSEGRDNFTIQTDGTTKFGQHFGTYDVATVDTTYVLGLRHVFSGSSQTTLDTLKEILEDLDVVQRELGSTAVSAKIVSKLKNSMSDRHAAEKLFNKMLAEYRADILPDIFAGWSELNDKEKEQVTRMNNFFCGLHFLVALADAAEATLSMWESIDLDDGTTCSPSGTQRLIHTACKAFHHRGSEQAGCSTHFRTYLRQKNIHKVPLAAFRGNRFNIVFYDAAGVFYLKSHMVDYLKYSHGQLNRLLQAVLSDLGVPKYIAGCKALGIIDKIVTGPLWRHLMQSTVSILNMSNVYAKMEMFEKWGQDAQSVLEREVSF